MAIAYHSLVGSSAPGQQTILGHRLRSQARIDAARTQEKQFARAVAMRRLDDIDLNLQVVPNELRGLTAIGLDTAYLRRGEVHIVGAMVRKEALDGGLIAQIEFLAGPQQQTFCPSPCSRRTMAEPTKPLWPATKIDASCMMLTL